MWQDMGKNKFCCNIAVDYDPISQKFIDLFVFDMFNLTFDERMIKISVPHAIFGEELFL